MNKDDKETRHAKWRALVEEQQRSELSQTDFCEQHGIVLSQFTYYYLQIKPKSKFPTKINTLNSFAAVSVQPEIKNPTIPLCQPSCRLEQKH